jgi:hypothetical protein
MTTSTSATFRAPSTLVLGNTIVVGSTSLTTPEVRAQRANVDVLVADVLVADGAQGAHGMTVANAVTFTNAAFAGPMVEKRVADSSRWGLGVSGAGVGAQSRTDVYTSATGIVTLGHALNDATVQPAVVLTRALGAATANVGINTSAPTAALHVAGNLLIQSGTFQADDHMDVFPDMPDDKSGVNSFIYEFVPTMMTSGVSGGIDVTNRLYYGTFATTSPVNSIATAARGLLVQHGNTTLANPTHALARPTFWGTYTVPVTGGYVSPPGLTNTGGGAVAMDVVFLLDRATQTYATTSTTVRGVHIWLTFPRRFCVRHVWLAPGVTTINYLDLTGQGDRTYQNMWHRLPDQIYVLGTNETFVGRGTRWYEIDFITAPRQPEQAYERLFSVGTSPALSTFRTICVVFHRVPTASDTNLSVSKLRLIGTPAADRGPVPDLILHEPFGSSTVPTTRDITSGGLTVTTNYFAPGGSPTPQMINDPTRGRVLSTAHNSFSLLNADKIVPFGLGADGSYSKACWVRYPNVSGVNGHLISSLSAPVGGVSVGDQNAVSCHFLSVFQQNVRAGHSRTESFPNSDIVATMAYTTLMWTHFVFTWDNVTKIGTLYCNGGAGSGAPLAATTTSAPRLDLDHADCVNSGVIQIGNFRNGNNNWGGLLDDVRVYGRALSAAEVASLYAATNAQNEWPPVSGVAGGGSWTKDTSDVVTGIGGSSFVKYKTTVSGAPYGNGQYVAWANTVLGYSADATYGAGECPPSGAFDKTPATGTGVNGWATAGTYSNNADASPQPQLFIQLPTSIRLSAYSIQCRTDVATQAPIQWQVHGSTDGGETFEQLDTQSNQTGWTVGLVRNYFLTTPTSVSYALFRLTVLRPQNTTPVNIAVSEWRLYAADYAISPTQ